MQNSHAPVPLLRPSVKVLTSLGQIEVRELRWADALTFLKMLSAHSQHFLEDGRFNFNLGKMVELITGACELSAFLLEYSVVDAEMEISAMPFHDALLLLDAALEVNLSPEILALAKKTAARFAPASGVRAATPAARTMPSPESSTS
jgi:hypothetical protein